MIGSFFCVSHTFDESIKQKKGSIFTDARISIQLLLFFVCINCKYHLLLRHKRRTFLAYKFINEALLAQKSKA